MSSFRIVASVLAVTLFWLSFNLTNGQASTTVCTQEGKFPVDDGTCTKYYMCVFDGSGYQQLNLSCATGSVFDPSEGTCVLSSLYECAQTTTVGSVTSTTTVQPCYRYGRFKIEDPNCQKYYLCFWDGLTLSRIDLQCPNSLRFDPKLERCVLQQNYPCT